MTPERWKKLDALFHEALELHGEARAVHLAMVCGGDEQLRAEAERLIAAHEREGSFIDSPILAEAAALTDESLVGRSIGHYQVLSLLGRGGMGEVYLAEDSRLERKVALKLLPAAFTGNRDRVRRFEREAKAASALNHPNILTIHEIGEAATETGGAHYIVSEFVEGETLRALIERGRLDISQATAIAEQVAGALGVAHEAGIIHRDIKPENVMVRPDGLVKVLDFGLAKLTEGQRDGETEGPGDGEKVSHPPSIHLSLSPSFSTEHGMVMGTVSYMSPEQASGQKVDHRTDIFSLGVMLYEMIAGRRPFEGATTSDVIAALLTAEPPPLGQHCAEAPAGLEQIVSKCLAKDREARYQSAKELIAELKTLRTSSQMEELAAHKVSGARTQFASRRWPVVAALAAVALAAIGFAWYQFARWSPPLLSAPFTSEKLSTTGKVVHAIVSSDGKNVVYTNGIEGRQSVWLRRLESASNIEIIPPSDDVYGGLAFSPNGQFLYFTRRPKSWGGQLAIYRMPSSNGIPTQIIGETQGWISLSADGEKISFVRCGNYGKEHCSLWIADAKDGKNERKLASRARPFRIGDNEISPDGKSVAFAVGQSENASNEFGLVEVNIESGVERELAAQKFFNIKSLAWLPNRSGLFITASVIPNKNFRVWHVFTASGKASPLTKDSETYSTLSLDKDARVLVSTHVKADFRLRLLNWENPPASQVLADARMVAFAPDGRVVFSSAMSGNDEIWSVNADGSGQRQLTNDAADDSDPVVSPNNHSVFFFSNRTGKAHVWRMNTDGSNQTQITQKEGGYPLFVSPDMNWLYYRHGLHRNLWRVSATGGDEQLVLDKRYGYFAFSPDGLQAAFLGSEGKERVLKIVLLADGRTIKTVRVADSKADPSFIAWLPDGINLAYMLASREHENNTLWLQSLDGGQPRQIAVLSNEAILSFAIAPDGKSFAIVQGGWRHDAVLLKGLK